MDAKFLRDMDNYLRENIQDEEFFIEEWLAEGDPDGSEDEDLEELCHYFESDPKHYITILESFVKTILLDSENG